MRASLRIAVIAGILLALSGLAPLSARTSPGRDPFQGGSAGSAGARDTSSVPEAVAPPADPLFRIQQSLFNQFPNVFILGPATGSMIVTVAVQSLTAYSLRLTWSPANLMNIGTPGGPGDPSQVVFTSFLESGGRVQSCAVTAIDPNAGHLDLGCTTSDPGGGVPATSAGGSSLFSVTFTPDLPGSGTLELSNLTALDGNGQPYATVDVVNGTFTIGGSPDVYVEDPLPPAAAYPGAAFSTSWNIHNAGFGDQAPPFTTGLLVSRDDVLDPNKPPDPGSDPEACRFKETDPLPGRTTVTRTLGSCRIERNVRPGLYTGFYSLISFRPDPSRGSTAVVPVMPRVVTVRKTGKGKVAETTALPDGPGGSVGPVLAELPKLRSRSVAVLRSTQNNASWMVRLARRKHGPRVLEILPPPLDPQSTPAVQYGVRAQKKIKAVLAGADIDGDGEDELVVLRRDGKKGDALEFQRMGYDPIYPDICPGMALTQRFPGKIRAAAGIQYDADPEDELAVVTSDGALSIYDVTLTGTVPPNVPCEFTPIPATPIVPATAVLTLAASDPAFDDSNGRTLSLCGVDMDLDGVEELGGLHRSGNDRQVLRIYEPPQAIGGSALLLADDPDFGGTGGKGRALSMSCTR